MNSGEKKNFLKYVETKTTFGSFDLEQYFEVLHIEL